MYVIQRVKAAVGQDGQPTGASRTHYAAAVGPAGAVTEWTPDRAQAVRVDDATALKVEDYYAALAAKGQPVGTVTAEDVTPVAPPVTRPVVETPVVEVPAAVEPAPEPEPGPEPAAKHKPHSTAGHHPAKHGGKHKHKSDTPDAE